MKFGKLEIYSLILLELCSFFCYGDGITSSPFSRGAYFGFLGGYGSTTWKGLVPAKENQNVALSLSTPLRAKEGGGVWGVLAGYEFIPALALEASYMRFSKAKVFFDQDSLFSFDHDDNVKLVTKTETLNLMGKILLPILQTPFRVFLSAGVAGIHRDDLLVKDWRVSPTFGGGLNYRLGQHAMVEIGGNYTAGYGESQLSPSDTYFPFLYSVSARLSYHF
ncbi:OmpA-like transmembrane domain protein [Legionella massiliensis]|uniref:OmpA-like transmembrane domain protein n=1 Tax=Legionella massiliensis TaxID=1034943 RepID=A0A078KVZ6_9GAMM|nr:outer membrane beta-barrel protein [Legionella massiliensis]CDZ77171.1 OmpA-like transmembrane domain protein [Legionella massiliensis]CEE12909.1 OmpA-like transmembrane domain protein [Legionella massiliensis]